MPSGEVHRQSLVGGTRQRPVRGAPGVVGPDVNPAPGGAPGSLRWRWRGVRRTSRRSCAALRQRHRESRPDRAERARGRTHRAARRSLRPVHRGAHLAGRVCTMRYKVSARLRAWARAVVPLLAARSTSPAASRGPVSEGPASPTAALAARAVRGCNPIERARPLCGAGSRAASSRPRSTSRTPCCVRAWLVRAHRRRPRAFAELDRLVRVENARRTT